MAKKQDVSPIDSIKQDFLATLADEGNQPSYEDVVEFGFRLQDEVGMDEAAAAHTLTGWAVEAGAFSKEDADKAESDAKGILEDAA